MRIGYANKFNCKTLENPRITPRDDVYTVTSPSHIFSFKDDNSSSVLFFYEVTYAIFLISSDQDTTCEEDRELRVNTLKKTYKFKVINQRNTTL